MVFGSETQMSNLAFCGKLPHILTVTKWMASLGQQLCVLTFGARSSNLPQTLIWSGVITWWDWSRSSFWFSLIHTTALCHSGSREEVQLVVAVDVTGFTRWWKPSSEILLHSFSFFAYQCCKLSHSGHGPRVCLASTFWVLLSVLCCFTVWGFSVFWVFSFHLTSLLFFNFCNIIVFDFCIILFPSCIHAFIPSSLCVLPHFVYRCLISQPFEVVHASDQDVF